MATSSKSAAALSLSLVVVCGTVLFLANPSFDGFYENRYSSSLVAESPPSSAALHPTVAHTHRRLSKALPDGGCDLTWPVAPPPGTPVTYAASYPGCGARMTWNLVEALTGLETGDDWDNNHRGEAVVTVKTHYPQSNGILPPFDAKIARAFIMIRNPMASIPSFFNHCYEIENHLAVHSARAPVDAWIKFRDAYLDKEIAEYKKFIFYWMDRYYPENRLLVTYEGITDDHIGPEVAKELNGFLGRVEGVDAIAPESVPCIWRAVVKNKPPPQQAAHIQKMQALAAGDKAPGEAQRAQQPGPQPGPQPGSPGQAHVKDGQTRSLAGQAQSQQQQQRGLVRQPQIHQEQQPGAVSQGQIQPAQQPGVVFQPRIQSVQQPGVSSQPHIQPAQQSGAGSRPASELAQQRVVGQAPPQQRHPVPPQQPQQPGPPGPPPGLRRRLDPAHHDSQRKGPSVPRPYTTAQLDGMMAMLLEVAERYHQQDVRLYHIMVGYYESVRAARLELDPRELPRPPGGFY